MEVARTACHRALTMLAGRIIEEVDLRRENPVHPYGELLFAPWDHELPKAPLGDEGCPFVANCPLAEPALAPTCRSVVPRPPRGRPAIGASCSMPCVPLAEGFVMRFWLAIVGLALTPRFAGAADDRVALEAEHTRLSEEMRMLAARNAWRGVEDSYGKLEALQDRGVEPTVDDVWFGAQAARSLGDLSTAYARLKTAQSLGSNDAIDQWVQEIESSYGPVELSVDATTRDRSCSRRRRCRSIPRAAGPSSPRRRASPRRARTAGSCRTGSTRSEIVPSRSASDGSVASVALVGRGPASPEESVVKATGARAVVGVGVTDVGDSTDDSLQPLGFLGGSVRVGVGAELQIAKGMGWFAEAGYHGTVANPRDQDGEPLVARDSVGLRPNVLHLGYGWTGLVVHGGDVALSIGPTIAIGGGGITGVADGCTTDCAGFGDADSQALAYQRLSGTVSAAGGSVGALWQLMDVGRMAGGLDLVTGVYYDGARTYGWATVAYAISPAARRR
jgi:hypothetical protein